MAGLNRLGSAVGSFRREARHGYGYAIAWFVRRFYLRFVRPHLEPANWSGPAPADRPLTIVIPAVEKDAEVLGHCLQSVRQFVADPVAAVWVVAPESARLRALAAAAGALFVLEDTILPKPARVLKTRGWVLQQFIKFNACHHVATRDYLVLDADTVFLRPQRFLRGDKSLLRYSDQYELLYNRSLELIFGHGRRYPVSFVTHHQLFAVDRMKSLLALLEQRFHRPWWEAIQQEMDQGHPVSFSEYEMYGHFIMDQPESRGQVALEYWWGLDRDTTEVAQLDLLRLRVNPRINTVSFHQHTQ